MEAGVKALSEEQMSAADKMLAMSHLAMTFLRADEVLMPVFVEFWAYALHSPKATERFRMLFEVMQQSYVSIIEEGVVNGEFRPTDVSTLSSLPVVVLDGTIVLTAVLGRDTVDPAQIIEQTQQLVFRGLLTDPEGGAS
jgi:hypothetical protein